MGRINPKNSILRRALSLMLCAAFLLSVTPGARAAEPRMAVVETAGSSLNVRSSPDGDILGTLPNGESVTVTEEKTADNGTLWYYIEFPSGLKGWCTAQFIRVLSELAPGAPQEPTPVPTEEPTPTPTGEPTPDPESTATPDVTATPEATATPEVTATPEPTPQSNDKDAYLAQLTEAGFPASYQEALWTLHQKYPNWEFRAFATEVDWSAAVEEEHVLGKSLVSGSAPSSWKSTQPGAYNWTDSTWNELDSGGWVAASREIIAHYMDPRNSLDSEAVFQFLHQGFDSAAQTREGLAAMVKGSFLADTSRDLDNDGSNGVTTYAESLYAAGSTHGINPYVLASMMIQEMGTAGKSDSISGTNSRFPGYYNAFNLGAYKDKNFTAVERGLWYASGGNNGGTSYGRPWNTLYKAVLGGAQYYAANFVNRGQNTLYLKRFNVQGSNMFSNQYMTNVSGAHSEGRLLAKAYSEDVRAGRLIFSIPVYNNMPASACPRPGGDGSPNTKLGSLSVSVGVLSPEFHRDTAEYTVIVPYETETVAIAATALDSAAAVSGGGEKALNVGSNVFGITVTAANGTSGSYTITVIRQEKAGPVSVTGPYRLGSDGRVSGIVPGSKPSDFLGKLGLVGGTAQLLTADGSAKDANAPVSTGDLLQIHYDLDGVNTLYGAYYVLIYGDVNGDGAVLINDLVKVRNHLLGNGTLTGLSLSAADANRDGSVMINDLIKLRNHIAGGSAIEQ